MLLVYYRKKEIRGEKEANKKKNKVMIQLLEACVFLPVSSASLVLFFLLVFFAKNIHILLFQKQILMTDFIIIRLQTIPETTVT